MPLSVTTMRSCPFPNEAIRVNRSSVVCRLTSKVRRLRLLMPISGVVSCNAISSSSPSCTSTSTAMPSWCANCLECLHLVQGQRRGDEQDGIRPHRPCLIDLVFVHHEILAQHRQCRRLRAPASDIPRCPGKIARRSAPTGRPRRAAHNWPRSPPDGNRRGSRLCSGWLS